MRDGVPVLAADLPPRPLGGAAVPGRLVIAPGVPGHDLGTPGGVPGLTVPGPLGGARLLHPMTVPVVLGALVGARIAARDGSGVIGAVRPEERRPPARFPLLLLRLQLLHRLWRLPAVFKDLLPGADPVGCPCPPNLWELVTPD